MNATKHWTILSRGQYVGTVAATIVEIEEAFGLEGCDWVRRSGATVNLRRPKRSKD